MIVSLLANRRVGGFAFFARDVTLALRSVLKTPKVAFHGDRVVARALRGTGSPLVVEPVPSVAEGLPETLRGSGHRIVAMVGSMTDIVIAAFDASCGIVLVTDASTQSLRTTQRHLRVCAELAYRRDRLVVAALVEDGDDAGAQLVHAAMRSVPLFWIPSGLSDERDRAVACATLVAHLSSAKRT